MSSPTSRQHSSSPRAKRLPPTDGYPDENDGNLALTQDVGPRKSQPLAMNDQDTRTSRSRTRGPGSLANDRTPKPCKTQNCEYKVKLHQMEKDLSDTRRKLGETEGELREKKFELLAKLAEEPKGAKAVRNIVSHDARRAAEERKRRDNMEASERKRSDKLKAQEQSDKTKLARDRMKTPEERIAKANLQAETGMVLGRILDSSSKTLLERGDSATSGQHFDYRAPPSTAPSRTTVGGANRGTRV